ncbi:hypothetical protein FHW37_11176 [Neorhizobium alkalisoli]|uniref:Uncharacterized protein n=1 Tax=Neorhizobium alkalisoli TaxID=528178 RepID=A0A561QB38_9HYPH|nr:hypothetical protein FHW37_11176 [Neorhizobium alkalisoli]
MTQGETHVVRLIGSSPVPYRFQIVGPPDRGVLAEILSDANGEAEARLETGRYVCYAENLSRGTAETAQFAILDGDPNDLSVRVGNGRRGEGLLSQNLRPSRATAYRALGSLSGVTTDDPDLIPVISPRFNNLRLQLPISATLNDALVGTPKKRFSVGLSVDTTPGKRGGWRALRRKPDVRVHSDPQKLTLEFNQSIAPVGEKVRISLSVETERVWQIYLPFFSSGLRATIWSAVADFGPELTLQVSAVDPSLSLVLASTLGSYPSGMETVSGFRGRETMFQPQKDPWAAIAVGLSAVRAGERLDDAFATPWLWSAFDNVSDAYVLWAWAIAAKAEKPSSQIDERCLQALKKARKLGRPYFSATGEIIGEMLNALALSSTSADVRSQAKSEARIWSNRGRAKIRNGPFYSWERSGDNLRSGILPSETYSVVVSGHVTTNRIDVAS